MVECQRIATSRETLSLVAIERVFYKTGKLRIADFVNNRPGGMVSDAARGGICGGLP